MNLPVGQVDAPSNSVVQQYFDFENPTRTDIDTSNVISDTFREVTHSEVSLYVLFFLQD